MQAPCQRGAYLDLARRITHPAIVWSGFYLDPKIDHESGMALFASSGGRAVGETSLAIAAVEMIIVNSSAAGERL